MIQLRNGLGISPNILLVFLSVLNLRKQLNLNLSNFPKFPVHSSADLVSAGRKRAHSAVRWSQSAIRSWRLRNVMRTEEIDLHPVLTVV